MTFKNLLPSLLGVRRNRGVALIITLGILALMLILVMSYAFDARATAQAAVAQNDIARARLMSRSGLERALGFLQQEFTNPGDGTSTFMSPASAFFTPSSGTWQNISLLPSADISFPAGFSDSAMEALYVEYLRSGSSGDTSYFSYSDTIASSVGWYTIATTVDSSSDGSMSAMDSEIQGRVIYTILSRDLWNPAVLTTASADDGTAAGTGYARLGASIDEISLMDILGDQDLSRRLHPTNHPTYPGTRAEADWLSYRQLFRNAVSNQADADLIRKNLFPHSVIGDDTFWNDINSDSIVQSSELFDRFDLESFTSDSGAALYDALLGFPSNTNRNTVDSMVPWLRERSGGDPAVARLMAAQLALYMVDWVDTDAEDLSSGEYKPTIGMISGTGNHEMTVQVGDGSMPGDLEAVAYGNEAEPALLDFQIKFVYDTIGSTNAKMSVFVRASVIYPYDVAVADLPDTVELRISNAVFQAENDFGTSGVTKYMGPLALTSGSELSAATKNTSADNTGYIYQCDWVQWGVDRTATAFETPPASSWYLQWFRIFPVQIYTKKTAASSWRLARQYPNYASGTDGGGGAKGGIYFAYIAEEAATTTHPFSDQSYYCSFTPKDPIAAFAGNKSAEYVNQWTTSPTVPAPDATLEYRIPYSMDDSYAGAAEPSWTAAASRTNPLASTSANPYGGLAVPADSAFTSLKTLGAVHSAGPFDGSTWTGLNRTLRFWSVGGSGATTESDVGLLDFFTFGSTLRGRLNINTQSAGALAGLVNGGPNSDDAAVVSAILNTNGKTGGAPYVRRSEIIKAINDAGAGVFPSTYGDTNAEYYAGVAANLCDTQYNYFTIIVTAQSMKDIGTWQDANPPPSTLKAIKWKDSGSGSGKYGIIHSESRLVADVVRNAYTGELRVLRIETLEE